MDSSEEEELFDGDVGLFEEPRTYPGADLDHIAAVLADPNPSSGQLQGRRITKQAKRRRPQHLPGFEDDEAGPSDLRVSKRAARKSQAGSRLPRIPEQCPFDPKGKKKQQMPSPVASSRQDHLHSPTSSRDTEGQAFQWDTPERQHKHGSSGAGPSMISPSLGQLYLDSDEEDEGPSQGRSVPSISTCAGPSSSAGPSVAHGGGRTSAPRKPKARRLPYKSGMHPFYDRPGEQETAYAVFCEACGCWVPSPPDQHAEWEKPILSRNRREEVWQQHLRGDRHAREVAARLAEEAQLDSMHHYRSKVLPAMKHAAEELRMLGVVSGNSVAPTVRQATRTANEILQADLDVTRRIRKLHRDVLTELVHHAGSNNEYQRLATRLAIERLACAWRGVADMALRPDGTLVVVNATPAIIACLAAQLPFIRATTVVISLATLHALDLAPATAALCLLARALVTDNSVRRLQLNLVGSCREFKDEPVPQISRVLSELNRTVELNTSFRRLFLNVRYKEPYVQEWAALKTTAVNAAPRQRMAVAMALHPRVGDACPLKWLPFHIIRDILDLAVPAVPCKFVLSDGRGVAKPVQST
ncbi:g3374 [Coccomyxa elongata]